MILKIVAFRDAGVDQFQGVSCVQHVGAAIRGFTDAVNGKSGQDNDLFRHPNDFELFCIGEFNSDTGEMTGCRPVSLCRGSDVKEKGNV